MNGLIKQIRGGAFGAAAILLIAAVPAVAEPPVDQPPMIKVPYGHLNLATERDQTKLHKMIKRAAMQVCQYDGVIRDLDHIVLERACLRKALASAEVQLADAARNAGADVHLATDDRPIRR